MPFIDDCDFDDESEHEEGVTCNRCGTTGLEWVDCGGNPTRWVLFDGKRKHECRTAAPASDFL